MNKILQFINRVQLKIESMSVMAIALTVSFFVHAVILAVKFEPEIKKMAERLPTLDVVLVNAKTKKAPEKADLLAQANLDRGGNTDADRKMKTALPAPKKRTTAEVKLKPIAERESVEQVAEVKKKETKQKKRVADLERQTQELLTQLRSAKKVETKAKSEKKSQGDAKKLNREALLAASIEMDRLEAQIAKQQEEYQKRPKRRFIGARTKAVSDALYLEAWRQKVERIGNLNYPSAAREQKVYGQLQMTVSIRADGSVEKIVIDRSSGSKLLDAAAKNIVHLAAPYAKFPPEMRRNTDILGITRTWTFTKEDMLATKGAG